MLKELSKNQIDKEMDFYFKVKRDKPFVYNEGDTEIIFCVKNSLSVKGQSHLIARLLNKYYGYTMLCNVSKNEVKLKQIEALSGNNSKNEEEDKKSNKKKESFCDRLASFSQSYKPIIMIELDCKHFADLTAVSLCSNLGKTLFDDTEILQEMVFALNNYRINNINFNSSQKDGSLATWICENLHKKALKIEINEKFLQNGKNIVKIVNTLHLFCQTLRQREVVRARHIDIKKLREDDKKFSSSQSINDFEYINGLPEIILSAPHAKKGMFEGKEKESESMSGSICKALNNEFGFSIIYKSKDNEEDYFNTKTNAYKNALYKNLLSPSTRLFLEIHILNIARVQDVTLFLPDEYNKEKLYQIINILNRHNLSHFSINSVFDSYRKSRTINQIKNDCFKMQICYNQSLIEDNKKLKDVVDCTKDIISLFL